MPFPQQLPTIIVCFVVLSPSFRFEVLERLGNLGFYHEHLEAKLGFASFFLLPSCPFGGNLGIMPFSAVIAHIHCFLFCLPLLGLKFWRVREPWIFS